VADEMGGPPVAMFMKSAPMMMEMDSAPMAKHSMMAMNNANGGGGASGGAEPVIRTRTSFPETWIFKELESGQTEILEMVPDTITSWIINAFQISPMDGLGLSQSSTKLTVFRPFFIVLNVPYSVVKGESFFLKVR
jgi:hypothetical protein